MSIERNRNYGLDPCEVCIIRPCCSENCSDKILFDDNKPKSSDIRFSTIKKGNQKNMNVELLNEFEIMLQNKKS